MTAEKQKLTREIIIKKLVAALEPADHIQAFWEGGAAAHNRTDEWSDIDLYMLVADEKVDAAFQEVEKALAELSPIKQKLEVRQIQWPDVSQAFYRLEEANEYLIIDLAAIKTCSPEKFLTPEIHGNAVFYFNKPPEIKPTPLNKDEFIKKLNQRIEQLRARFKMFNNFVQKEINRGNLLEAIELYRTLTLATLLEALRIKHNPIHCDFKTRYIHYELPSGIIEELERLSFIENEKDLQDKYLQTTELAKQILESKPFPAGVI